jgi:hypothetical protein
MGQKLQPEVKTPSSSFESRTFSSVKSNSLNCKQLSSSAPINNSRSAIFHAIPKTKVSFRTLQLDISNGPHLKTSKRVKITVETEGTTQAFVYDDFDQFDREFTPKNCSRANPLDEESEIVSIV